MPTGTGKTITRLALITSTSSRIRSAASSSTAPVPFPRWKKSSRNFVLQAYREKHVGKAAETMALGLSRKNM